jgi:hypothetical protein
MRERLRIRWERATIAMQERRNRVALLAVLAIIVVVALVAITYGIISRDGQDVPPPDAPSDLAAEAVSALRIDLTWRDNSDNELEFSIERYTQTGGDYDVVGTVGADVFSFSDTSVLGDTAYYYKVQAYNDSGYSDYSNVAAARTPVLTPPNAPSNLGAEAVASGWVDLSWWDNADNEAGFTIMRRAEDGIYRQVETVGADVTEFSDVGLTESTTYFYQVRAYNDAGQSAFSNEVSVRTPDPTYHIWGGVADGLGRTASASSMKKTDRWIRWSPDPGYKAPEGTRFAAVAVSVTSLSPGSMLVSPLDFTLRDIATRETFGMYSFPGGDVGKPFDESYIGLNMTKSGVILYVIPKEKMLSELEVVYYLEGSVHIWPRVE